MNSRLIWSLLFLAGWWFTPESLWVVKLICLGLTVSLIFTGISQIYRRNFGKLTHGDAYNLVNEVLQPMAEHPADQFGSSWCEVWQVYAAKKAAPPVSLTEEQRITINEQRAGWGANSPDYHLALESGLIAADEYATFGSYVLTEMGLQYGGMGPAGGYEFYLNKLKRYYIENGRSSRKTAAETFVLEFERTELAQRLKQQPTLQRTFDIKAERTDGGDWFLTELVETGLSGEPKPFPLAEFRNWRTQLKAE